MAFNPDNPLNFTNWGNHGADGADIEIGSKNSAGDNEATIILVNAAQNCTLSVENHEVTSGSVGLAAKSLSEQSGVGAIGVCRNGVGIYGATNTGVGVVGRAMSGQDVEKEPIESLVPEVGVLGHAVQGAGIRGHGGETFSSIPPEAETRPRPIGAVFSAGRLEDGTVTGMPTRQKNMVSEAPFPQIQLIPSVSRRLPDNGRIGDFYLAMNEEGHALLFICTECRGGEGAMIWRSVTLGTAHPGGSKV
ncbi:hypothetical protein [Paraburkholderia flagellata]|uniref:hypothetical protein n=1 Tax=Paraburkholderia flagellata TaxID=2883241 RepID=UPI001F20ACA8|nr:hypothetical protein [Paraburkholderia flagellata]